MYLPGVQKPQGVPLPSMGGPPAVQGAAWQPQAGGSPQPRGYLDRGLSGSPFTPQQMGPNGSPMSGMGLQNVNGSPFQLPQLPGAPGIGGRSATADGLGIYDRDTLPRMGTGSSSDGAPPGGLCPASSLQANSMARPLVLSPGGLNGGKSHHRHQGNPHASGGCDRAMDEGCDPTKEEECNAEDCGDEMHGPQEDHKGTCGFDARPLLPVLLVGSTIIGAAGGIALWMPLLGMVLGEPYCDMARYLFITLYAVTCGCMAYCAHCDPGQVPPDHPCMAKFERDEQKKLEDAEAGSEDDDDSPPMPHRAHKAWQYARPIRRYDHYCRWLANCIGLLNHREFVIMCIGLVTLGTLGSILDFVLILSCSHHGDTSWAVSAGLVLHLIYSLIMGARVFPILQLHVGFISRNELANEWKRNDFYVITSARTGKVVPVNDLSDDEHNERFDSFHYAAEKNSFDKGVSANCWSFWCTPRWSPNQTGEF